METNSQGQGRLISEPPPYCQYASGPCDQSFNGIQSVDAFFLFPSEPKLISATVEGAIKLLRQTTPLIVTSWREIGTAGQLIFCRICQRQRYSGCIVPDVSTLNYNVLFEIGYAMGLGLPVVPVRDTSLVRHNADFDELGLLSTFGYVDFENSEQLANLLPSAIRAAKRVSLPPPHINRDQPLYVIKSPVASDGLIKLLSGVKKSGLRFRAFDPKESSRLSLQEGYKQIHSSFGVIAHLMMSDRRGSRPHNARAAFLCGMALALGKHVLMLQEGLEEHPIDYRDVIKAYSDPNQIQALLGAFISPLYEDFQSSVFVPITLPLRPLETLDFGDVAAENEIYALRSYFVPTAQYQDVRRGHARLVVGRKGSGKSAIFYGVRNAYWTSRSHLVLDLKPEGHQFTKLREMLLDKLSQGNQEHLLTAFWNYILLVELAYKIIDTDADSARRRPERMKLYSEIQRLSGWVEGTEQGDFSERLLSLVNRIIDRSAKYGPLSSGSEVTELIYSADISELSEKISVYLQSKEGVWLLFDNLDKGWPVSGAGPADILIIRSLLEATRKLQRQLDRRNVECHAVVFIRNDIYEHLLVATPDKGKDTAVALEWDDPEVFKSLVHRRITTSTGHQEPFEQLWATFFDSHVGGEESLAFILGRTLMRPRDLLMLLRGCVNVAVNRGHSKVTEADIIQASKTYSEDQLQEVSFELRDVAPELSDILYEFIGSATELTEGELENKLISNTAFPRDKTVKLLLWFGFLGVLTPNGDERYAYQYHYGVSRMLQDTTSPVRYIIHPAFRNALGCI